MPLWTLARESKDKENGLEGRGKGVRIPEGTTYRDITQTENRTASAVTHTILCGAGF